VRKKVGEGGQSGWRRKGGRTAARVPRLGVKKVVADASSLYGKAGRFMDAAQ